MAILAAAALIPVATHSFSHLELDIQAAALQGAIGVLLLTLCAESRHVRRLGYQAIAAVMKLLTSGASFAERPQVFRPCAECFEP